MLIRFTQKLSKKLKIGHLGNVDCDPGPFLEWYGHLFTAERVQYIVTTEAKSLLSVVMYGRGVTDDNVFLQHWLSSIREYLIAIDKRFIFEKFIDPHIGCFTFSKTQSKSILGSMNEMVQIAKAIIPAREMKPFDISHMLNKKSFKKIKYQRPIDAFSNLKCLKLIK